MDMLRLKVHPYQQPSLGEVRFAFTRIAGVGSYASRRRRTIAVINETCTAACTSSRHDFRIQQRLSCWTARTTHCLPRNKNALVHSLGTSILFFRTGPEGGGAGGRTLQDAIVIVDDGDSANHRIDSDAAKLSTTAVSALQAPVLLLDQDDDGDDASNEQTNDQTLVVGGPSSSSDQRNNNNTTGLVAIGGGSTNGCTAILSSKAANSMRRYLEWRTKCQNQQAQIRSWQRSIAYQRNELQKLEQERQQLIANEQERNSAAAMTQQYNDDADNSNHFLNRLDEIKTEQLNCQRVIAQLEERQLPGLQRTYAADSLVLMTVASPSHGRLCRGQGSRSELS